MSTGKECSSRGQRIQIYETETAFEGSCLCVCLSMAEKKSALEKKVFYDRRERENSRNILMGKRQVVRVPSDGSECGRAAVQESQGSSMGLRLKERTRYRW